MHTYLYKYTTVVVMDRNPKRGWSYCHTSCKSKNPRQVEQINDESARVYVRLSLFGKTLLRRRSSPLHVSGAKFFLTGLLRLSQLSCSIIELSGLLDRYKSIENKFYYELKEIINK